MIQATKQALNELGEEWGQLPPDAEPELRLRLSSDIFWMAYELFKTKSDAIGEFFLRDFPHFDPSQASLYGFMSWHLDRRMIDIMHKDHGDRRKTVEKSQSDPVRESVSRESLDGADDEKRENAPADQASPHNRSKYQVWVSARSLDDPTDKDGDLTILDLQKNTAGPDELSAGIHYDERVVQFLSLVFQLPQRLCGRARNPQRLNYFLMFFTDGVVDILQQGLDNRPFIDHERELFQTLQLGFMDFFLLQPCRDVRSVAVCPDKPYGELVPGRPMSDPGHPLPNDVYITYLNTKEGCSIRSPGTISNQRKEYERFLREGGLC